ncbi:MAG: hypothetical protein V3T81_08370 [Thermoanaerobaculia bacterium]
MSEPVGSRAETLNKMAQRGIDLCRQGSWQEGVRVLGRVAESNREGVELPGRFFSYLGYGIARVENRVKEGLSLCQHAIKKEFYQPENYANLARTYLLSGRRLGAFRALQRGLSVAPRHRSLDVIRRQMGIRRGPLIPLLPRSHPINRLLGRLRYTLFKPRHW